MSCLTKEQRDVVACITPCRKSTGRKVTNGTLAASIATKRLARTPRSVHGPRTDGPCGIPAIQVQAVSHCGLCVAAEPGAR